MSRAWTHRQYRQCGCKTAYTTREEAEEERQRQWGGAPLFIYACPWMPHFHLTHEEQRHEPSIGGVTGGH
jgi:hypothetical protein